MKCKGCGNERDFSKASGRGFQAMSFGRKQCTTCGAIHTKAEIDAAAREASYYNQQGWK